MAQIFLDEALGITENMAPKEISDRWIAWKLLYKDTDSYRNLSPAITSALDLLSASVIAYESSVSLFSDAKSTYDAAITTYNAAMAIITGGASTTLIAAQEAYKTAISELKQEAATLYNGAKQVVSSLLNAKVDSSTQLDA